MKEFEIGKYYGDSGRTFLITKKTAKTITVIEIDHYGRFNERREEPKRLKLYKCKYHEEFYTGCHIIRADYHETEAA